MKVRMTESKRRIVENNKGSGRIKSRIRWYYKGLNDIYNASNTEEVINICEDYGIRLKISSDLDLDEAIDKAEEIFSQEIDWYKKEYNKSITKIKLIDETFNIINSELPNYGYEIIDVEKSNAWNDNDLDSYIIHVVPDGKMIDFVDTVWDITGAEYITGRDGSWTTHTGIIKSPDGSIEIQAGFGRDKNFIIEF